MTLFVNSWTAMRFWCMTGTSIDDATAPCSLNEVKNAATSLRAINPDSYSDLLHDGRPLHILVADKGQRSKSPQLVYHTRKAPYPAGAFRRYAPDTVIASPELCFLEMANELPFFKLVEFGYLLCGTYTVNPDVVDSNKREPLTTKRKLTSFIDRMGVTRGCEIARKALGLVCEGSASVRETKTTVLLCTPVRLGGYGLVYPILNHRIDFSDRERLLFGRTHVVIDLYWKEHHFGIEYDGVDNHSSESDVSKDRRKSSDLDYHGIQVLRIDKAQLANPYQVYVLAKKCARHMGKTLRKPTPLQLASRQKLFDEIMH